MTRVIDGIIVMMIVIEAKLYDRNIVTSISYFIKLQ